MKDKLANEEINKSGMVTVPTTELNVFDPPEGFKGYFPPSEIAAFGCINCEWRGTTHCPYKFKSGPILYRKYKNLRKQQEQSASEECELCKIPNSSQSQDTVSASTRVSDTETDNSDSYDELHYPLNKCPEGICKYRKDYLISLTGEWDTRPSGDQLRSRLLKTKGLIQNSIDEQRYMKISGELETEETRYKDAKKEFESRRPTMDSEELKSELKLLKEKQAELTSKKIDYANARADKMNSWKLAGDFIEKQVDRETVKKVEVNDKRHIPHEQMLDIMRGKPIDVEFKEVDDDA